MISPEDVAQIVTDARLTPEAVRLVLYIATLGDGEQEISNDDFRVMLACKSDKPVYAARERATRLGYIRWQQGGRDHHNRYLYLAPVGEVKGHTSPPGGRYVAPIEDGEEALTPVVPLHPLAPDAEEAIEKSGETLHGCRDSLRDYLRRRVPPPRQSSYVHDVAGKINGLGFAWRTDTGAVVPMGARSGLMAAAINELAATDEKTGYKAPPGDPRNLRTKLNILASQWGQGQAGARRTGTDGPDPPRRGRKLFDDGDYGDGTTEWKGLNG